MGLGISLSNALSGMAAGQTALDITSRNVANSGTVGYHRQSVTVIDGLGTNSTFARTGSVQRAFNQSLQAYYTSASSDAGYTGVRSDVLDRLQTYFGKPGDDGSLDTLYGNFQNSLQALGTSPDNYGTRADVLSQAQNLASGLNALTNDVQGLRQETESQMSGAVDTLNQSLSSLAKINVNLGNLQMDGSSRASLLDQRDRLVGQISELVDVRVDYRSDDTVALMTKSGVGLLDNKAAVFSFEPAGGLDALKTFDTNSDKSGVGKLILTTVSGTRLDLGQQKVLQSGKIAGLLELRDTTLTQAQAQLDDIAAGLAQAFSTVQTAGTAATSGAKQGLSLDLSSLREGNAVQLSTTQNGINKSLSIVRVDDTSKLPLDYVDANGTRVVGMNFSGGASSVAGQLQAILGPSFTATGSGSTLTVLDDGAADTTSVSALTGRSTATALQDGTSALNLFVDSGDSDFTNSLGGRSQKLGFAGRIAINSAIASDNKLLVQYQAGTSLGDATRPNALLSQLQSMSFATSQTNLSAPTAGRIGGTVDGMVTQTMDYTGSIAASAAGDDSARQLTLDNVSTRMDSEYGVDVNEEMANLLQLQNAYAANARVISTIQDLLTRLMDI